MSFWQYAVEKNSAGSCLYEFSILEPELYACVYVHPFVLKGKKHLLSAEKELALTFYAGNFLGHVIDAQYHVLRGHSYRLAVGWRENVLGRKHEYIGFKLCGNTQRHMHRHLVAVKVCIEGRTYQGM